jgi:hypothetical protein
MKIPVLRFALVLASLGVSRALAAQEIPDRHAGQWAAEFSGGNFNNIGVMRFFSPRSALVLSGYGSLSHNTAAPDGSGKRTDNTQSLSLALGVRRHATVASRVLATTELGANMGLYRSKLTDDGIGSPTSSSQSQTNYGLYGEIGAQYFVASHLALGGVLTVNANMYSGRTAGGGSGTDYRGFALSTGLRPIRVTLYF